MLLKYLNMNNRIYLIINKKIREYRIFECIWNSIYKLNPDTKMKITQTLDKVIVFTQMSLCYWAKKAPKNLLKLL